MRTLLILLLLASNAQANLIWAQFFGSGPFGNQSAIRDADKGIDYGGQVMNPSLWYGGKPATFATFDELHGEQIAYDYRVLDLIHNHKELWGPLTEGRLYQGLPGTSGDGGWGQQGRGWWPLPWERSSDGSIAIVSGIARHGNGLVLINAMAQSVDGVMTFSDWTVPLDESYRTYQKKSGLGIWLASSLRFDIHESHVIPVYPYATATAASAVPEPSTFALLSCILLGVLVTSRPSSRTAHGKTERRATLLVRGFGDRRD